MNKRIDEIRLDAGIARIKDHFGLLAIDREGNVIDALIGLEKFAELLIRECLETIEVDTKLQLPKRDIDRIYSVVKQHFGVE